MIAVSADVDTTKTQEKSLVIINTQSSSPKHSQHCVCSRIVSNTNNKPDSASYMEDPKTGTDSYSEECNIQHNAGFTYSCLVVLFWILGTSQSLGGIVMILTDLMIGPPVSNKHCLFGGALLANAFIIYTQVCGQVLYCCNTSTSQDFCSHHSHCPERVCTKTHQ